MNYTEKALNKLSGNIRSNIEEYKRLYKQYSGMNKRSETDKAKAKAAGYLSALRDCNVITEQEKRAIYCYVTL